jgi:hypothetical protein
MDLGSSIELFYENDINTSSDDVSDGGSELMMVAVALICEHNERQMPQCMGSMRMMHYKICRFHIVSSTWQVVTLTSMRTSLLGILQDCGRQRLTLGQLEGRGVERT